MEQALVLCAVLLTGSDLSNSSQVDRQDLMYLPVDGPSLNVQIEPPYYRFIRPDLLAPDQPMEPAQPRTDQPPRIPTIERARDRAMVRM